MTDEVFDLEVVNRLLSTTRSVRKRLDLERPVPRQILLDCIDLSQQAPNGENAQRWRWIIVDEPELKREIAKVYQRGLSSVERLGTRAETDVERRMYASVAWLVERLAQVPALVFPCFLVRPPLEFTPWHHGTVYASILPAVWSFQLALRSRGLGSTLTTMHLRWEADISRVLGVPDSVLQVAMLPVAFTRGTEFKPVKRPDVCEIVSLNGWGFSSD
jgi:nitroreductase